MNDKIQALAEKIYKDGVAKASGEADRLVASAQAQKDEIIAQAKREAQEILSNARDEAKRMREQAEVEIRMSISSAKESLKNEVTNLLAHQSVTTGVDDALSSPDLLYNIVVKMSEEMIRENGNGLKISTPDAEQLTAYFNNKAAHLLEKGVTVEKKSGVPASFDIAPKSGGYKLSVSEEAFVNYFKEFLRPKLRDLLFPAEGNTPEA